MPTHYQVLGVHSQSGYPTIRAAYLKIMKRCHPDIVDAGHGGYRATPEDVYRINRAYSVLRDPRTRAQYDAELHRRQLRSAASTGQHRRLPVVIEGRPKSLAMRAAGVALILCVGTALVVGDWLQPVPIAVEQAEAAKEPPLEQARPQVEPLDEEAPVDPGVGDAALLARDITAEGAIAVSADCYASVAVYPSPAAADQCIAFDLAFARWHRGQGGDYFKPIVAARRHAEALKQISSLDRSEVATRISVIHAKVNSAIVDALGADIPGASTHTG